MPKQRPIWIHYLINTGSSASYLTSEAIRALAGSRSINTDYVLVDINGRNTLVGTSVNRFSTVNILGMDFIMARKKMSFDLPGS